MKHIRFNLLLAATLILAGFGSLIYFRDLQNTIVTPPPQSSQIAAAKASAPAVVQTTDTPVMSGEPDTLSIPSLNIGLQITPGVYNYQTKQWTLTNDKVQYAVMTPEPNNQSGNTFLYGHYRRGVLATLHAIKSGASAVVTTKNGKTFTYVLASTRVVSPEQSDAVFAYHGAPILTIQTCTGIFFENRQLFIFNLESVV